MTSVRVANAKEVQNNFEDRISTAKYYLRSFGTILSIYSSAIRAITAAPTVIKSQDSLLIDKFAVASSISLIRISPTITNAFFFAAEELYPKELSLMRQESTLTLREILKLFRASEIIAVMGLTYFFRLMSKRCDPEELLRFAPIFSMQLSWGALVGDQVGSQFGRGGGLAAAGLRCLGVLALMNSNPKAFKKYRRFIEENREFNYSAFEIEHFGCTHLDVASVLAGELGFGPVARQAFISFQTKEKNGTQLEQIYWNHVLTETSKLFASSELAKPQKHTEKTNFADSLEGYTWLWGRANKQADLFGVNIDNDSSAKLFEVSKESISSFKQEFTTNQSILIVEDEVISAKLLDKQLTELGNVTICESAESAMSLLANAEHTLPFNLILLDVGLPGISGLSLLNNIREIEDKVKTKDSHRATVLMITGDGNPQTVMKAFSHGADGYLTKPLQKSEISDELAKHNIFLPK